MAESAVLEKVESSSARAYPQVPGAILKERKDDVVGESLLRRKWSNPAVLQPVKSTAVGSDPEAPLSTLIQTPHRVVGKAVFGRVG